MQSTNEYWIDSKDQIVRTGMQWDTFAAENQGDGVRSECVLGTSLWEHIHDESTRTWMRALIAEARAMQTPIFRQYRCDSPDVKRYMQMRLEKIEETILCITHVLLQEKPMDAPVFFVPGIEEKNYLLRCSICNKINAHALWLEPDEAVEKNLIPSHTPIKTIHTVCPSCSSTLRENFPIKI